MTTLQPRAIGTAVTRLDGPAKVTGTADYAYEYAVDNATYLHPVQATIAKGRITTMDTSAAEAVDGVLAVLTAFDKPRLADTSNGDLTVLQGPQVNYRGQLIGGVIAESAETARHAAALVHVEYDEAPHDVALSADHPKLYAPDEVNAGYPTDTSEGDVEAALRDAPIVVDQTYSTPHEHNNPMEPHACIALWDIDTLTLWDSTQGVHAVRKEVATTFGLQPEQVRVIAKNVGGGFGSKGSPHSHNILAVMAAQRVPGRPVKLAVTRQQMFDFVGYRTPTIQHLRLAAERDGTLTAISHEVVTQTATVKEFAEQAAVPSRMMYAGPNRKTSHRVAALDVPVPFWMRAPGECPGMYALEVAMDELAVACGVDPVELRIRNEPDVDPETGNPWSDRRLVECLQTGAERFGWTSRDPEPGTRCEGEWLVGTGVASSVYPAMNMPGNGARIECVAPGRYAVGIGAVDIGTGTWTALSQIAADALGCELDAIDLQIGDTDLPAASVEGGSSGISSWGRAIVAAAQQFRRDHGDDPAVGVATTAEAPENEEAQNFGMYSFGAHFVEARVSRHTGEIRVSRMLGVFSVGRVINPVTLRSQLIGGMTMGLSMALHEESVRDPRFGHVVTRDLATYHISSHADVPAVEAMWLDDVDKHSNPMGSRGAGEIGIVGSAAAVVNAVYHATGIRVRDLPVMCDAVLVAGA
ncbi:xanthine dehydrogenase family protein molybdopterin-binding subunit [Mycolicibacterium celeriflavum]|uniref:Xanthine dehydrogenase n=1 Tax=Mycolicibacterium celeriflavum TaxID=1249101 RepID=A0A1X0BUA0_MYCCF|nr:xanthine dehydrogenase family protein molybdopterin-binding subunit [Mycolicibacterium celeriflavum]MCV7239931.1 xanthine dehydrogenase family protein molybdopterin-binding subunit [Mycolicibacterium celeriflavum]ORA47254.1 xanthine dehydrogenase [Mycolicibacterium celeriflavum]BBY44221.1 xanthine dehydrogenase [Mycolicibacterium celeriflavum]